MPGGKSQPGAETGPVSPAVWPGRAPTRAQANQGQGQEPPFPLDAVRGEELPQESAGVKNTEGQGHAAPLGSLQGLIWAFVYDLTFYRARTEPPHWKT